MRNVIVSGPFDDLHSRQIRFLQEAARLGSLQVLLWSDERIARLLGKPPKFPLAERQYFLNAIRFVSTVSVLDQPVAPDALPELPVKPDLWAIEESDATAAKHDYCRAHGMACQILKTSDLAGFPLAPACPSNPPRPKVIVTGCYDWFHSGHIRFFEEVSELGDLYVAVGNDANVRNLKGAGHPMFSQTERQFLVGSIRFVTEALVTSGWGWLDAEPEIKRLKPEMYAVNEDGDKPEKREYCERNGIRYVVLKRIPKAGLPRRQSTDLRGF